MIIDDAFILAAGMGSRLRPYTENIPKPMVEVGGVPMIGRSLNRLAAHGVKRCGVNTHYKAEVLESFLKEHTSLPEITIFHEEELLNTGGGVKNAASMFERRDFFVLSGDAVWEDAFGCNMLDDLAAVWDPEKMDILIALQSVETMKLTGGVGDYDIDKDGRAVRSKDKSGAYMWTSVRINGAHIFDGAPLGRFSYLQLLDLAQARGRLYAHVYEGNWHHISTPADLEAVNSNFSEYERGSL